MGLKDEGGDHIKFNTFLLAEQQAWAACTSWWYNWI